MATIIKNMTTGQELSIGSAQARVISEGRLESRYRLSQRFFRKYGEAVELESEGADGIQTLLVREGWELVQGSATAPKIVRATKAKAKREPQPTEPSCADPISEPTSVVEPEPVIATESAPQAGSSVEDALSQAFAPFAPIVTRLVEQLLESRPVVATTTKIECATSRGTAIVEGTVCANFDMLARIVDAGKPLYMFGPAGCGKSYTARQIAAALSLPYYETSQAMFAHDLKGYGDATGNYVQTAFYRAFTDGGLFFLDEVDASSPEALVVLNNAIANGRFDFPVVGNVEAHPNFRVIAAGNTRMTGATVEYTARQMQDASFKNRFFYIEQGYDNRIELQLAREDDSIVEFAHDLRKAARIAGISQLVSYRQIQDLADLQDACGGDDAFLVLGSVVQEKQADEVNILFGYLDHKDNRWAQALRACVDVLREREQQG